MDRLLARLEAFDASRCRVMRDLDAAGELVRLTRDARREGCPARDLLEEGPFVDQRERLVESLALLVQRISRLRGELYRLARAEGLPVAAIADRTSLSRQYIERLMTRAAEAPLQDDLDDFFRRAEGA